MINFLSEVAHFDDYELKIEAVYLDVGYRTVRFTRGVPTQEMILLRHLMDYGDWVPSDFLRDSIFGHRSDGGAEFDKVLHVLMHKVRSRLRDGYFIENRYGSGYRLTLDWKKFEQAAIRAAQEALAS